ncbi:5-deoxy-glucuronate isomerase [Streptomyces xiaopingdaonensis]|uniref:5-deoxy-glucuronate isomerase n=1 Tax=Streptomyces xiaopingdaonensis TaxID=1565415 RepID=UPI0002ED1410|nr:5-deoxy-glucuronate isomerase [Streptomyces xiaopingdaonensis]
MTTHSRRERHLRGRAAQEPYVQRIDPRTAGWSHSSLHVVDVPPGGEHTLSTGGSEWIVLPLAGACTVEVDGYTFDLAGRASVFEAVSDFAYLPRAAEARLTTAAGGRFACAGAVCENRLPARYGPASGVPVELRGAGTCSRQVNNFAAAGVFPADRLIAVEVLTPGGNWSSYPPHKHDLHEPGVEAELEEVYYYEFAPHGATDGYGFQRVTPSGRGESTDILAEVRDGDAVLIPDGWHGPSVAAPGHHMYYLNVMAGPSGEREWLIRDHPDHTWIRGRWPHTPVDGRLPLYGPPPADPAEGTADRRPV